MQNDMVERVARAIARQFYDPDDWNGKFCMDCARAAIAAMPATADVAGLREALEAFVKAYGSTEEGGSKLLDDADTLARAALRASTQE